MNLTSRQAAQRLGVALTTVRAWGEAGLIERTAVGNGVKKKHYLYSGASVNALKKEKQGKGRMTRTKRTDEGHIVTFKVGRKAPADPQVKGLLSLVREIADGINTLVKVWS